MMHLKILVTKDFSLSFDILKSSRLDLYFTKQSKIKEIVYANPVMCINYIYYINLVQCKWACSLNRLFQKFFSKGSMLKIKKIVISIISNKLLLLMVLEIIINNKVQSSLPNRHHITVQIPARIKVKHLLKVKNSSTVYIGVEIYVQDVMGNWWDFWGAFWHAKLFFWPKIKQTDAIQQSLRKKISFVVQIIGGI